MDAKIVMAVNACEKHVGGPDTELNVRIRGSNHRRPA